MSRWDNYDKGREFWNRVEKVNDCLVWAGARNSEGYGATSYRGKFIRAHRLSYILVIGNIPEQTVLDHLCRNTSCVNPEHLEPVSNRENVVRGFSSRETCRNGHPRHPLLQLTWASKNTVSGYTNHCKVCRYIQKGKDVTNLLRAAGIDHE